MSASSLYLKQGNMMRFKRRKARFSFSEVHILLDEVRKNRHIVVGKFNSGIPSDVKRRKWAEITARVNEIGECDREIMEVIKKWSDLKCDTKRKLAAQRTGTVLSQRLARSTIELSPMESIVESILELDKNPWEASQRSKPSHSHVIEQEPVGEDEDEEDGGFVGVGSLSNSPVTGMDMGGMPGVTSGAGSTSETLYEAAKSGDGEFHIDSDDDKQFFPSSSMASVSNSLSEEDGAASRGSTGLVSSSATFAAPAKEAPIPTSSLSGLEPDSTREQLAHNASLSVQEQHMANTLLSSVSRSLQLLAESMQQLAETQQEFAQQSLQLQRETVQVLRDFASGAVTILQEKVNGKPAL